VTLLRVGLVLVAAVAATVVANVVLLGVATGSGSSCPGKLSPRAAVTAPAIPTAPTLPPPSPRHGEHEQHDD
jgi:hypothetical protein